MRTPGEIRAARSTIAIPSFWKLVAIPNAFPNVATAHARVSDADATSKSFKSCNLYRDYREWGPLGNPDRGAVGQVLDLPGQEAALAVAGEGGGLPLPAFFAGKPA